MTTDYTPNVNLYKWKTTDTKQTTITETALNADKIDTKLSSHETLLTDHTTQLSGHTSQITGVNNNIGNLANLTTTDKTSVVNSINEHTAQLADIASYYIDLQKPKNGLVGVTGVGDETSKVQAIINAIPVNKTAVLFLSDITLSIQTNITFPSNIRISGRNATILMSNASIVFSGNNIVDGVIFDGNLSTTLNGIQLNGSNIIVRNCTFKQFKANVQNNTMTLNITAAADNILVENNVFDGIYPYDENLTQGDNGTVARAIYSKSVGKVIIRTNTFKNMVGWKDSDYIHIYTAEISDTAFPFNQNVNIKYAYTDTIIENNVFFQDCKSCIKVMGSGVVIKGNIIHNSYSDPNNIYNAIIRIMGSEDVLTEGNQIFIASARVEYSIVLQSSTRCKLSNNKIMMSVNADSSISLPFRNIDAEFTMDCQISDNHMVLRNVYSLFYSNSNQNLKISRNKIRNFSTTVTNLLIYRCYHATLLDTDTVFDQNEIISDCAKNIFQLSSILRFSIIGNSLKNCKTQITLASSDLLIENNVITSVDGPEPFVIIQTGGNTVKLYKNDIYGQPIMIFDINALTTKIKMVDNLLDYDKATSNYIFDIAGASGQNMAELTYKSSKGCQPIKFADYGATGERPSFNKDMLYPFYDTTLSKPIWWNGTTWKDGTGTAV